MNNIVLVMTTDKNYIIPTRVSIYSILASAKEDTFYEIHIMCDRNLDDDSRENLLELEKSEHRLKIVFNEIRDDYFKEAKIYGRFSLASYYRLFISKFINADKCIFIDGDTIVKVDLWQLYDMDIEKYYVAGVKSLKTMEFDNYEKYLGIPSIEGYISAGVLVFNLRKLREDGIDKKFVDAIKVGYRMMDQDIINKYCYGKIKYLSPKFNFYADLYGIKINEKKITYSITEFKNAEKEVRILHYTGTIKPWLCRRVKINQTWWQYAEKALRKDDYENQVQIALQFEKESDWSYILDKIKKENQIIVVGFTDTSKNMIELLKKFKPNEIVSICDNDTRKHNLNYMGIKVQSVENAFSMFSEAFWIITNQAAHAQIAKQLKQLGVKENKIIRYIHKDDAYYEGLDEKYHDYEEQMLKQC